MFLVDQMKVMSALYWNVTPWVQFLVLSQRNNSPQKDTSRHSDTLYWFQANQSLFVFLDA